MQFFCKMCYDLGRPDFNKHNVRDSARNTTCPYLLNTKCKNCGYFGHTSTYCKNTRVSNFTPHKSFVKHIDIVKSTPTPTPTPTSNNAFHLLNSLSYDDDDHDDDDIYNQQCQLPDLSKVQWGKIIWTKSWADQAEEEENMSQSWAKVVVS